MEQEFLFNRLIELELTLYSDDMWWLHKASWIAYTGPYKILMLFMEFYCMMQKLKFDVQFICGG